MSEVKTYPAPAALAASAHIGAEQYNEMYTRSINDPGCVLGRAGGTVRHMVPEMGQGPGLGL